MLSLMSVGELILRVTFLKLDSLPERMNRRGQAEIGIGAIILIGVLIFGVIGSSI